MSIIPFFLGGILGLSAVWKAYLIIMAVVIVFVVGMVAYEIVFILPDAEQGYGIGAAFFAVFVLMGSLAGLVGFGLGFGVRFVGLRYW